MKTRRPNFRIEEYFDGRLKAWGVFQDRFGRLRRQFEVDIYGSTSATDIRLEERFVYDDGEREERTWTIRTVGRNGYEGETEGVIGKASGEVDGNTFHWTYRFALTVGKRTISTKFDDWMFLQTNGILINRASVFKFGMLLGQATIVFDRNQYGLADAEDNAASKDEPGPDASPNVLALPVRQRETIAQPH